jgi:DNA repair exonuclease SbcCD ATPase subunit
MRSFCYEAAFALAIALLIALTTVAQQPAVGRKRVPRMTTDDVARPALESATESPKESAKPEDAAKAQSGAPSGETKTSAEESSWRERVREARNRAKQLERAADEAELRTTSLRNEMGVSGQTYKERNQSAAELEELGRQLAELRAQARAANEDLNQLLEYGRQKNFRESDEVKAESADGKPNEEYYRSRYAKILEEMETADRRVQLYENRISDLSQRILQNGGKNGGDNFYTAQIEQDRQEAQQKLDEARAARAKAQSDLDALMEEARRAGIAPGVFR